MNPLSRRKLLQTAITSAAAASTPPASAATGAGKRPQWQGGIEGQRRADIGNGSYLNPIVSGDHPDPTILKDGHDYYMTFSSFQCYPGAVIWHSTDLTSWAPITAALTQPIGTVWAMDLVETAVELLCSRGRRNAPPALRGPRARDAGQGHVAGRLLTAHLQAG